MLKMLRYGRTLYLALIAQGMSVLIGKVYLGGQSFVCKG
jgi:hypothetical protein